MLCAKYGHDAAHPAIANALGSLENLYRELGKFEEAEARQLECLRVEREIFGHVHHLSIAGTLWNLGEVYRELSKL